MFFRDFFNSFLFWSVFYDLAGESEASFSWDLNLRFSLCSWLFQWLISSSLRDRKSVNLLYFSSGDSCTLWLRIFRFLIFGFSPPSPYSGFAPLRLLNCFSIFFAILVIPEFSVRRLTLYSVVFPFPLRVLSILGRITEWLWSYFWALTEWFLRRCSVRSCRRSSVCVSSCRADDWGRGAFSSAK